MCATVERCMVLTSPFPFATGLSTMFSRYRGVLNILQGDLMHQGWKVAHKIPFTRTEKVLKLPTPLLLKSSSFPLSNGTDG
jgi:hypothetical protein